MCVLNYEFHILDNAFLVHRPGIKYYHKDKERDVFVKRTQVLIKQQILPELKLLYGTRKGCTVWSDESCPTSGVSLIRIDIFLWCQDNLAMYVGPDFLPGKALAILF